MQERASKYKERQALLFAEASRARRIAGMREDIVSDLQSRGMSDDLIAKAKI